MRIRPPVSLRLAMAAASVACLLATWASAASKIELAAIQGMAPGGGQFLGPSLTGTPNAAGNGWIAFRTLITGGGTSEQIIGRNLAGVVTDGDAAFVVASIGQTAPRLDGKSLGSFKQFLGRPTVNANGDVAFTATLTNSDVLPGDPNNPIPAGVFVYRRAADRTKRLRAVGLARDFYDGFGQLEFGLPIDPLDDSSGRDLVERTPAMNDAGDIAFAVSVVPKLVDKTTVGINSAAIFLATGGGRAVPVVKLSDTVAGKAFAAVGPPALTNAGTLVFRGLLEDLSDGIFAHAGTQTTALVTSGHTVVTPEPDPVSQELLDFGPVVAANDAGDVVFTAGPLFDTNLDSLDLEGAAGVFVLHAGELSLLAYPGQTILTFGRVSNTTLGPEGANAVAPPGITADGQVVFLASLNGGKQRAIFRIDKPYDTSLLLPYVVMGGANADASPIGGKYQAAASAPAVDAVGNITFYTRLTGTFTSEALLFLQPNGGFENIQVGGASPKNGTIGGPPFSSVVATDDRVVFKSFLAAGASAVGIFQWQQTSDPDHDLSVLVRANDAVPLTGAPRITDLVGDVSVNDAGDIAFAATLGPAPESTIDPPAGRVVLARRAGALAVVATVGMPVPTPPAPDQSALRSLAATPLILADGSVVFRGSFDYPDPLIPFNFLVEDAIFLVTPAGTMSLLARSGQASPIGLSFLRFRDVATGGGPRLIFRSTLDDPNAFEPPSGLFFVDLQAAIVPIALQGAPLPDGPFVDELSGRPVIDRAGNAAYLAKLTGGVAASASASVVRRNLDGTSTILAQATLPGPLGGTVKGLGRPTIAAKTGHVAFRMGFESGFGGAPGYYLATDTGTLPLVLVGESGAAGTGERFASISPSASLDSNDRLAFVASVSAGDMRNGVFLASPAALRVKGLGGRFRESKIVADPNDPTNPKIVARDSIRGRATLPRSRDYDGRPAVTVSLQSASSTIFTSAVSKQNLVRNGSGFSLRTKVGRLRSLTVKRTRDGWAVAFAATGVDIQLAEPPFVVRIDVGSDSASAVVPCEQGLKQLVCTP